MNYKNNATVRYYIYKELRKFQETNKKEERFKINGFVLPIYSAIISSVITEIIKNRYCNSDLLSVLILTVIFFAVYFSGKLIAKLICKYRTEYGNQINKADCDEELANKINYDVTYLIHTAQQYIEEESDNKSLKDYYIIEALFYTNKAVSKLNKTLFASDTRIPQKKLQNSRIITLVRLVSYIIDKIQICDIHCKCEIEDEIKLLISEYENVISGLAKSYDIDKSNFKRYIHI